MLRLFFKNTWITMSTLFTGALRFFKKRSFAGEKICRFILMKGGLANARSIKKSIFQLAYFAQLVFGFDGSFVF
jgi:predicted membrane protein